MEENSRPDMEIEDLALDYSTSKLVVELIKNWLTKRPIRKEGSPASPTNPERNRLNDFIAASFDTARNSLPEGTEYKSSSLILAVATRLFEYIFTSRFEHVMKVSALSFQEVLSNTADPILKVLLKSFAIENTTDCGVAISLNMKLIRAGTYLMNSCNHILFITVILCVFRNT